MNQNQISRWTFVWIVGLALLAGIRQAAAQGTTAFTYQGQLRDGGTNANGAYTFTFKLYDAVTGGGQIGSTIASSSTLGNGLFSVNLDFGASAFNGSPRWLDITAQSGTNVPETLTPRVQMLPAPYALYAAVAATVTNGAIMNAQLATNSVATTNVQDGSVTDAKIVSVSGGKVIGSVASASSLVGGTWNVSVGNYQTYTNILRFIANGSTIMAAHANGVSVNGEIEANILTLNSNIIQFSGQPGAVMSVNTTGDFIFDNNVRITALGNITLPAPGGSRSISANNQGITVDGISVSAANGVVFPNGGGGTVGITASGQNIYIPVGGLTLGVGGIVTAPGGGNFSAGVSAGSGNFSGPVNATIFNTTSDRNVKEQFAAINPREILDRVVNLPISSWNFKTDGSTRHIGPMAQDFYAAFNVGTDDKHIATVDEGGVALAAIQGLNEKLKEKDAEIEAMEKRLAGLEELIKSATHK